MKKAYFNPANVRMVRRLPKYTRLGRGIAGAAASAISLQARALGIENTGAHGVARCVVRCISRRLSGAMPSRSSEGAAVAVEQPRSMAQDFFRCGAGRRLRHARIRER